MMNLSEYRTRSAFLPDYLPWAAAISTLLGIGAQAGDTQDDTALVRALRDGAAESINRAGQRIVERQLSVQPTLTVRPGMPVRVILSRDLILEPHGSGS